LLPHRSDMGRHATSSMTNFVLIPGAWMGAWVWEEVADGLRALGHHVSAVTLSGLSKGADVSTVGLATHVNDVLSILSDNDLREVVVVGHLYSGIVAGQVADRAPTRVAHTVFVEAFLPHDGKSMLDTLDERQREDELRQIAEHQGRWPAPDLAALSGNELSAEQMQWLLARFVGHPGRTICEPAVLSRPLAAQRATYIVCTMGGHWLSEDVKAMRKEPNWTFRSIQTGHFPMVSTPKRLVELLDEVATG
jgi:pimeloyl-ACP methyl ester carboxylesterase